jgi:2,4-dienoyl-CoA reductase-like NADH-dependent reductase (Old Yellow Enzyme family)
MLKDTIRINQLVLRNRIVMPPMATGKADHGAPDDNLNAYYAAHANGTALIIVEHAYISPEGMAHNTQLSMADDSVVPAYRKLTDAVHERGAAVFAQISHAGAKAKDSGLSAISPSGVSIRDKMPAAKEMTVEDIEHVKECFVSAALRAKAAGFDGVEIHSAHGYLLNQFYSPLTNHRTDAYNGQTLEGRTRLHAEILRAVRASVGDDYTVAIRFGACD